MNFIFKLLLLDLILVKFYIKLLSLISILYIKIGIGLLMIVLNNQEVELINILLKTINLVFILWYFLL